jgi:hypothetical protein
MNYQKLINEIESKLTDYPEVLDEIKSRVARGCTGGEITSIVGHYLKHLHITNKDASIIIKKEEIVSYLKESERIGLFII